jgi:hypothetical protein
VPIWQVSHTDGIYQVADADGALYPLTMNDLPISQFNEGWTPRGLQTGVPPLHVLELEHVSGASAVWLHDETLNYRANAVHGLPAPEKTLFFETMEPVARSLYEECVLAPHASIPAVAHRFEGLLPGTVAELLGEAIMRAVPRPDGVQLAALAELDAGYGNGATALSAGWIQTALAAGRDQAQESIDLPGHRCQRHLDAATGRVFYRLEADGDPDRPLYVPSASVVFSAAPDRFDAYGLVRQLICYYAANTDRVVSLPEALDLQHDVVPSMGALPYGLADAASHEDGPRTSFEAPLSETLHAAPMTASYDNAVAPHEAGLASAYAEGGAQQATLPAEGRFDAASRDEAASKPRDTAAPPTNWWQRLLGLGNS